MVSKKAISCGLGLLTVILFIGFTGFLIHVSVTASRDATLKMTTGGDVAALAAYIAEGSRGLRAAALAAKNAWTLEQMPPWNAGNDTRSLYLMSSLLSIQKAYGSVLRYVYVSYQLPNSAAWGDLGCQASATMGPPYSCYYVNTSSTMVYSDTANVSQIASTKAFYDTSMEGYTKNIRGLKASNVDGNWMPPDSWVDTLYNVTTRVMSFTLPIRFDSVTGNCTLAVTTDLDLGSGALGIQGYGTLGEMVLLDGRGTGFMIDGSLEHFFTNTPTQTPSERVNDLVKTFSKAYGGNLLSNGSITMNGFNYQSSTIDSTFVLINRAPISTRVQVASSALKSTFDLIKVTAAAGYASLFEFFTNTGYMTSATPQSAFQFALANPSALISTSWFATLQALMSATFPSIAYLYVDYELTNSSNGWGEAGAYFVGNSSLGPQGLPTDYAAYITADNGTEYTFTGLNLTGATTAPSSYNLTSPWIMNARALTQANAAGRWQPLRWSPTDQLMYASYQWPVAFNATGNCTAAYGVDVDIMFLQSFLLQYKASSATQLVLLDTRGIAGNGGWPIVVASATASYAQTEIFTTMSLPDVTLGQLLNRVTHNAPGGNMSTQLVSFSFYDRDEDAVVSVVRVPDVDLVNWAVVEITPANTLKQLFTSAQNVADSFTGLFTPAQRVGIFIFAGVVVLMILIDHIVILTMKVEDASSSKQWETAMNQAA